MYTRTAISTASTTLDLPCLNNSHIYLQLHHNVEMCNRKKGATSAYTREYCPDSNNFGSGSHWQTEPMRPFEAEQRTRDVDSRCVPSSAEQHSTRYNALAVQQRKIESAKRERGHPGLDWNRTNRTPPHIIVNKERKVLGSYLAVSLSALLIYSILYIPMYVVS